MTVIPIDLKQVGDDLRRNMEAAESFAKVQALDPGRVYFGYTLLPFWYPSVLESDPPKFDLYAINS